MTTTPKTAPGTVYLVGAGPGDPGLLTVRAVECLGKADLVLYDYLVNPAALKYAAPSAELACLGGHGLGRSFTPDEINVQMVEGAQQGKTVVRLKGGDPSVFARGADEREALRGAGIPYEIIPGITAGIAAAAYCEIPITHHDDASAVAFVVGQERHSKASSALDFGVLAGFPGTLIFYMGVTKADEWSQALIENGKPPETPVAIVRWCTRTRQQTVRCTLGTVVKVIEQKGLRPPSLFIVGKVIDYAPDLSWFAARPLFGTRVLVTGSPATSEKLRDRFTAMGADVVPQPAIRITDPPDWAPVDAALEKLDTYDWLVLTSANGVDHFLRRLFERGDDTRRLAGVKLAVIGSGTAERLARYSLNADLSPEKFNAEALAQALSGEASGKRFLLAQASRGRQVLADELKRAGAEVDKVVVYSSVDVEDPDPEVAKMLSSGEIDWITVTSSATARSLVRLYGDALRNAQLTSMSPLTSKALGELGYEPAAEAAEHTTAGIVDSILQARDS